MDWALEPLKVTVWLEPEVNAPESVQLPPIFIAYPAALSVPAAILISPVIVVIPPRLIVVPLKVAEPAFSVLENVVAPVAGLVE